MMGNKKGTFFYENLKRKLFPAENQSVLTSEKGGYLSEAVSLSRPFM